MTGEDIQAIFAPGECMEGQVIDYIIDIWTKTNEHYRNGERVMLTPGFIKVRSRGLATFSLLFIFMMIYNIIQIFSLRNLSHRRMSFKFA